MKNFDESRNRQQEPTSEKVEVLQFRPAEEESGAMALFPRTEIEAMRVRWKEIQTTFVDDPKSAVENADTLVADAVERITKTFSEKRSKLEEHWGRGDQASTEDLRQALQRYRAFFDRLLSI
jgi:hypothetical protein